MLGSSHSKDALVGFEDLDEVSSAMGSTNDLDEDLAAMAAMLTDDPITGDGTATTTSLKSATETTGNARALPNPTHLEPPSKRLKLEETNISCVAGSKVEAGAKAQNLEHPPAGVATTLSTLSDQRSGQSAPQAGGGQEGHQQAPSQSHRQHQSDHQCGTSAPPSGTAVAKVHPHGGSSVVTSSADEKTCQSSNSSHESLQDAAVRQANVLPSTSANSNRCEGDVAAASSTTVAPSHAESALDDRPTPPAVRAVNTASAPSPAHVATKQEPVPVSVDPGTAPDAAATATAGSLGGSVVVTKDAENVSNIAMHSNAPEAAPQASPLEAAAATVPSKSVTFGHLRTKYLGELEYMLREFRKLERQLLGAKGAAQLEESAGSRERREKLHSFILHLEDTIRQIELGCKVEAEGKHATAECLEEPSECGHPDSRAGSFTSATTCVTTHGTELSESSKLMAEEKTMSIPTKGKGDEENVQKLEEHILANLLPVKVRLKKQLAAQQGATQNPAGMPSLRRGSLQPPSAARGKGTFAEAAEKRRQQAEAARLAAEEQHERAARRVSDPSQFGKPLSGGGSSLTQKLHGPTLGSTERVHGYGVGTASKTEGTLTTDGKPICTERKILYGGLVPGSTQQESGLSAASGVHEVVGCTNVQVVSSLGDEPSRLKVADPEPTIPTTAAVSTAAPSVPKMTNKGAVAVQAKACVTTRAPPITVAGSHVMSSASGPVSEPLPAAKEKADAVVEAAVVESSITEDEKRRMRKQRRKRKLLRLARRQERERVKLQAPVPVQPPSTQLSPKPSIVRKKTVHGKSQKKKGPRAVEYICALCSEAYASTCDYNPWWALAQHDCPKCRKNQIPRIDITSPANAIEYHPALLAHIDDNGSGGGGNNSAASAPTASQGIVPSNSPTRSQLSSSDDTDAATLAAIQALDSESDTDLSELSDDDISIGSLSSEDSDSDLLAMTPAELAENETFGSEYTGPCLPEAQAARLLILIGHASTCPCRHRSKVHRDVCISTKYLMLHVRDCPGTTSTLDVCPFPWCRKVKHLLYHLVSCDEPERCAICSPKDLSEGMMGLIGLNSRRMKQFRNGMIAASKAAAIRASAIAIPPHTAPIATSGPPDNGRKLIPVAPAPVTQSPTSYSKTESKPSVVAPNFLTTLAANPTVVHGSLIAKKKQTSSNISSSDRMQSLAPPPVQTTEAAHDFVAAPTSAALPIQASHHIQTTQVPPSQQALVASPPSTSPPPASLPEAVNQGQAVPANSAFQSMLLPGISLPAHAHPVSQAIVSTSTSNGVSERQDTGTCQVTVTISNDIPVPVTASPREAVIDSVDPISSTSVGTNPLQPYLRSNAGSSVTAATDIAPLPPIESGKASNATCVTGTMKLMEDQVTAPVSSAVDDSYMQVSVGTAAPLSDDHQDLSNPLYTVKEKVGEDGFVSTILPESNNNLGTLDPDRESKNVENQLAMGGVQELQVVACFQAEVAAVATADAPPASLLENNDGSSAAQSAPLSACYLSSHDGANPPGPATKDSATDATPKISTTKPSESRLLSHSGDNMAAAMSNAGDATSLASCPGITTFARAVEGTNTTTATSNATCQAPSSSVVANRTTGTDTEKTAGPVKVN